MKKFLVACRVGGIMEMPDIEYEDYQIIEANSPDEAENIYNKINNCEYFYAKCLGELNEETRMVYIPISFFKL